MQNDTANNILEMLEVDQLPPEEQEELLLQLGDLVFSSSIVRLMERMDEETREEFDAFLGKNPSDEELTAFLEAKVPNADEAVLEVLEDLRSDILTITG